MVEGARLESVCIRKGTEGSNPSLSAEETGESDRFFTFPKTLIDI